MYSMLDRELIRSIAPKFAKRCFNQLGQNRFTMVISGKVFEINPSLEKKLKKNWNLIF